MNTPLQLRKEILKQFGEDLVSSDFNFSVGYIKGSTKLSIRSCEDIEDIWSSVSRGENVTLWCDKVRDSIDDASGSDSDDPDITRKSKGNKKQKMSALEAKNERIEGIVASLREKHATAYTTIQYRLWAEMVDVGTHK